MQDNRDMDYILELIPDKTANCLELFLEKEKGVS